MVHLTIEEKKVEEIVWRAVQRALHDFLSDPDRGLEVRASFGKKLTQSAVSKKRGLVRDFDMVIGSL